MNNSISRTLSRSRKALSNALLVYHILLEGATIQFFRSKISHYALKVLRGDSIIIDSKKYQLDDFIEMSQKFCSILKPIIDDYKKNNQKHIIIDKESIDLFTKENNSNSSMSFDTKLSKTDCRNRESAFSNFMAYILISRGYKLHLNTNNMKETCKVMHFFVWNAVTSPQNVYFEISEKSSLIKLISLIEKRLTIRITTIVNKSILDEIEEFHSSKLLSVFIPVTDSKRYMVTQQTYFTENPFCK
ncbi:hypothetical protein EDI_346620 [Entamoeba dispar SAW760]|uniref:Uncharacterized protein n=1 Tax=Entamoeba dispar (strain ATCC PRA-260 / SAW760) TaxID=370354 RepID=B0E8R2_ENTDS|nr:uncharacterized protein EDI_346620 [Entamoeba dispar SAW760]EDR29084.1 hypothetical protein EDI_346620 [Entamoeba dispar SAW760]|eukprot:EDR29084.1 hypothetical protein EDI_346620 [Entamoeba dispar SAW760]